MRTIVLVEEGHDLQVLSGCVEQQGIHSSVQFESRAGYLPLIAEMVKNGQIKIKIQINLFESLMIKIKLHFDYILIKIKLDKTKKITIRLIND